MAHFPPLRRRYFAVRHGQSEANVEKIIVSDPEVGCVRYGLTDEGKKQAVFAADHLRRILPPASKVQIHTSDFLRTLQTAAVIASKFPDATIHPTPLLRERRFGGFEGQADTCYRVVWEEDAKGRTAQLAPGVEDTAHVRDRGVKVIKQLEEHGEAEVVILVGHGDTLQILQTAFEGLEAWQHRSLPLLQTAEVRELVVRSATN
ncbi:hypothetical protein SpCBS45565_g00846 [Spizellomyces sp. 'palustris']|nr:hypothetical protein SpCBS45565_g00846 [Spizellomyces sp. 'palustris']